MKTNNQLYFMVFLVLFVAVMTWKPIVEDPKVDLVALIEAKLSEGLVGLQSQVEDFQTRIDTLETANSALQTQVDTLETANSNLQESVNTLEAANTTLQTSINTLETASSALKAKVDTLETSNSTLKSLLSGVTRLKVGGYDTLRFSGMNLQIINDKGSTATSNGLGNLIVGYNERREGAENIRTGSHYVVIGSEHNFSAYGGIVAGVSNTASSRFSSVSGGSLNTASGWFSSVSGGMGNTARAAFSSISGGTNNTASGGGSSVSGGANNTASGQNSSILGGHNRTVNTQYGIYPQ